jgi:S-adenosyl methyltransferase
MIAMRFSHPFLRICGYGQANRAFLRRAVQYLVQEAGIRQFLDIGTGLPTAQNTHEVAVMLLAIMQFIPDADGPQQIVSRLMDAVPPGSYLAMSNATLDFDPSGSPGAAQYNARVAAQLTPRTRDQVARFFEGLDLVEPGLVPLAQWRALARPGQPVSLYAAVGVKTAG